MIMLYKKGTELIWEGKSYDIKIVEEGKEEHFLKNGWYKHVNDIPNDENTPPTREEMELKAKELGIQFDGRTADKTLLKKIEEALNVD